MGRFRFEGGFFIGRIMDKQIAYSTMVIKAIDEDKREFTGIASTPEPDRVNDVMIPKGAKYKLPMPFLWQHDHRQPIGEIYEAKATDKGIEVKGRVKKVDAPSQLSARLDEAWVSMKEGLVRGLSIGFRPLKYAFLDSGGVQYDEWDWYELSAVTIPMSAASGITAVKSFDREIRASMGGEDEAPKQPSGSTEKKLKSVKLTPKEGKTMSLAEKLKGFEDEYSEKSKKLNEMMEKSLEEGSTFDAAQEEEYQTLEDEVKALEGHIEKAKKLIEAEKKKAVPVTEKAGETEKGATEARSGVAIKKTENLEKGIEFARYAMCRLKAKGNPQQAAQLAKTHYPNSERVVKALDFQAQGGDFEGIMKATVEAGTTLDSTFAAPLVDYQNFAGDFVDFLRPRTIVGQFGQNGVPGLNNIPFNVRIAGQTSGGNAYWVGEGAPKPLTAFDFNATELRWNKIAAISVLTQELIRFSSPSAERLVRDALAAAVIERMDIDFVDPTKAAVSNVSPASITNGVTPITSSGVDADAIRADLRALWATFIAARNTPRNAVYIMDSTTALALSLMQNPLGQQEFPGITMNGGTFNGVPVIVSDYLPVDTAGGIVILANASDIWLADDGQVTVDASDQASLQMLDNPTNNSATGTATSMVSMFQTNSVAFRAERFVNWAKRRTSAVAYLDGVNWGADAA